MQSDLAINVRQVSKIYSTGAIEMKALDRVNFQVDRGEVVFLMGPSGSGKTTLLSIMGCILRPTSGSIRIEGREVAGLSERELPHVRLSHIGFIFQGFNLFPALTARENIELALGLKGIRGRQARHRAAELLDRVGLVKKLDSKPADMSGGQKQRVAIARALAGEPQIILADEPTAALDSKSGNAVMELLCELAREHHRAVVIVTHDTRMVNLADRLVHIEDGQIVPLRSSSLSGEWRWKVAGKTGEIHAADALDLVRAS